MKIRDHIQLQFATYSSEMEKNENRLTIVVGGAGFTGHRIPWREQQVYHSREYFHYKLKILNSDRDSRRLRSHGRRAGSNDSWDRYKLNCFLRLINPNV